MALRLILIRHAKSDWSDPDLADADRTLNARGRAACDAVGPWLAGRGHVPDTVLCSSAARTRETWSRLHRHLPAAPAATHLPELYLASADDILSTLRRAQGASVALIGHNPGIGDLAGQLCNRPPSHPGFGNFPTLSTLVLQVGSDGWAGLAPCTASPVDFVVPRDLTD